MPRASRRRHCVMLRIGTWKCPIMVEIGSSDRTRSDHATNSDSESRPTSVTSYSVDEDMNINEVGVTPMNPVVQQQNQPRRNSVRKSYSLATTGVNLSDEARAMHVEQLRHIVHVSYPTQLYAITLYIIYIYRESKKNKTLNSCP